MGIFHVFKVVLMVPYCAKHHYLSSLCVKHKWFEEEMGYAPPEDLILVPRIEWKIGSVITLDKRRQQMTFGSGEKSVISRLDIIFSITHVSRINLFCQWDIRRYPWGMWEERYQTSYHVRKLKNSNG